MSEIEQQPRSKTWIIVVVVLAALLLCCCAAVIVVAVLAPSSRLPFGIQGRGIDLGIPMPGEARRTVEQSYDVDTPVVIEINNEVGQVHVTASDQRRVSVKAVVRARGGTVGITPQQEADAVEVSISQNDRTHVSLSGRIPKSVARTRSPDVDFTVSVPRQCQLDITQNVGQVSVQDVEGALHIVVNAGSIDVANLAMKGDTNLRTDVGTVKVSLPAQSAFRLDARADVGQVTCTFALQGVAEKNEVLRNRLVGVVGDNPTVQLTLSAGAGAVNINKSSR